MHGFFFLKYITYAHLTWEFTQSKQEETFFTQINDIAILNLIYIVA